MCCYGREKQASAKQGVAGGGCRGKTQVLQDFLGSVIGSKTISVNRQENGFLNLVVIGLQCVAFVQAKGCQAVQGIHFFGRGTGCMLDYGLVLLIFQCLPPNDCICNLSGYGILQGYQPAYAGKQQNNPIGVFQSGHLNLAKGVLGE